MTHLAYLVMAHLISLSRDDTSGISILRWHIWHLYLVMTHLTALSCDDTSDPRAVLLSDCRSAARTSHGTRHVLNFLKISVSEVYIGHKLLTQTSWCEVWQRIWCVFFSSRVVSSVELVSALTDAAGSHWSICLMKRKPHRHSAVSSTLLPSNSPHCRFKTCWRSFQAVRGGITFGANCSKSGAARHCLRTAPVGLWQCCFAYVKCARDKFMHTAYCSVSFACDLVL